MGSMQLSILSPQLVNKGLWIVGTLVPHSFPMLRYIYRIQSLAGDRYENAKQ